MNVTPQLYADMSKQVSPKSKTAVNVFAAFFVGGSICAFGQIILEFFKTAGFGQIQAGTWEAIVLIAIASLLTGIGVYEKIAKHAGAGTLVPITGFSNAISSCAIESQSEGAVLGIGTKIFTIAGPVILYGCVASVLYGIVYYFIR